MKKYKIREYSIAWWTIVIAKLLALPILLIEIYILLYWVAY